MLTDIKDNFFYGYQRPDGSVGIRNNVAILAAMDNINPVVRAIASQVEGAIPVTTIAGRGQFGADNELTQKTIINLGKNPNIGAVLVVSLEPVSAERIANEISKTGKLIDTITVQECGGTINATCIGCRIAADFTIKLSEQKRKAFDLSKLILSVECGGSDTTSGLASNPAIGKIADKVVDAGGTVILSETSEFLGAEHILAKRAINEEVAEKIYEIVNNIEEDAKRRGVDIRGANPVPDNIKGGLTTIEEKSLGAIAKGGNRTIQGVLEYAEAPGGKGLYLMDTPAPAVESLTGLAAGGSQLALFSTGVGNSIGHPVITTMKITANPNTERDFSDNIDFSVTGVITGKMTLDEASLDLFTEVLKVASGKKTRAEVLKQLENANAKIERTV